MKESTKIFGTLILAITMMACKSSKQGTNGQNPLENGDFDVVKLGDSTVPEADVHLKINLDDSRISGNTGCNNFSAELNHTDDSLSIGPAKVTKMFCQGKMKTEKEFLEKLKETKTYTYNGEDLNLKSDGVETIITAKKAKRN